MKNWPRVIRPSSRLHPKSARGNRVLSLCLHSVLASRMIIGIGSDLIDIRRIERVLARLFTDIERARSERRAERAASYAKRFAAKEACAKALGTGMSRGVFWKDMGVVNLPGGKPTMRLTNGAAQRLAEMLPADHKAAIHLTITDDFPLAQRSEERRVGK